MIDRGLNASCWESWVRIQVSNSHRGPLTSLGSQISLKANGDVDSSIGEVYSLSVLTKSI